MIRALTGADRAALPAFLGSVYPIMAQDPAFADAYYGWKYFDLAGRETGFPAGFLAEDEQGIAGFIGCMPFTLRTGDRQEPAGWIADWHLHQRARGRGLGRALLKHAAGVVPALASIDGTPEAEKLYAAGGFTEERVGRHWMRVRRPLAYEWPRRSGVRKPLGLYRAAGHLRLRREPAAPAGLRLMAGGAGPAFAAIAPLRAGLDRSNGYLEWLCRAPVTGISRHAFVDAGGHAGYGLLLADIDALGRRRGRILDMGLEDAGATGAALALAARHLEHSHGVDYVETIAPIDASAALAAGGFRPKGLVTLWLLVRGGRSGARWPASFIDKDNAFRGSANVP